MQNFDAAVQACAESFLGCSFNASEWSLANLSTKSGGLGLRKTEEHSPAAYFASHAACHTLCEKVDPHYVWNCTDGNSDAIVALAACNARMKPEARIQAVTEDVPSQQKLSKAIDDNTLDQLRAARPTDAAYQAHLTTRLPAPQADGGEKEVEAQRVGLVGFPRVRDEHIVVLFLLVRRKFKRLQQERVLVSAEFLC